MNLDPDPKLYENNLTFFTILFLPVWIEFGSGSTTRVLTPVIVLYIFVCSPRILDRDGAVDKGSHLLQDGLLTQHHLVRVSHVESVT